MIVDCIKLHNAHNAIGLPMHSETKRGAMPHEMINLRSGVAGNVVVIQN